MQKFCNRRYELWEEAHHSDVDFGVAMALCHDADLVPMSTTILGKLSVRVRFASCSSTDAQRSHLRKNCPSLTHRGSLASLTMACSTFSPTCPAPQRQNRFAKNGFSRRPLHRENADQVGLLVCVSPVRVREDGRKEGSFTPTKRDHSQVPVRYLPCCPHHSMGSPTSLVLSVSSSLDPSV